MDGLTQSTIYDTESPPNIYSATTMRMIDGSEKIIMVSSKTDIITLETKTVGGRPVTSIVKINFSNIPSNAEIIAISCTNKSKEFNDFVVGITYNTSIVEENDQSEVCFNNYKGFPGSSLEAIIENCETIKLNFLPLQLNHATYLCEKQIKEMWLLSGNDKKIHAYKIDEHKICEQKIQEYFVEYKDIKFNVLSFSTKSFSDYKKRISFYGCDTGFSKLTIVDSEKNQILHCVKEHYQSLVTVVQLFNINNRTYKLQNILSGIKGDIPDYEILNEKEPICLLVSSVVDGTVVYMDVLKNHLKRGRLLPNTDGHQIVSTSLIADINFDSKNEILLGTTDNYILNYVYQDNKWIEQQERDMRYSVFTINYLDITNQGIKDAVVMTGRGIHILKHEPKDIVEILKYRLEIGHH